MLGVLSSVSSVTFKDGPLGTTACQTDDQSGHSLNTSLEHFGFPNPLLPLRSFYAPSLGICVSKITISPIPILSDVIYKCSQNSKIEIKRPSPNIFDFFDIKIKVPFLHFDSAYNMFTFNRRVSSNHPNNIL